MSKIRELLDLTKDLRTEECRAIVELLSSKLPECQEETIKTILDAPDEWKQDVFAAALIANKGSVHKALKEVGVSHATYKKWQQDSSFLSKVKFAKESWIAELFDTAYSKAVQGDNDMIKFLMGSIDPAQYDAGYRKQALQNQAQSEIYDKMTKEMSQADFIDALKNDPLVDYSDPEYYKNAPKH